MTARTYRYQPTGGPASEWASDNPVLLAGEVGYETDTGKEKVGDGQTAWNDLGYRPTNVDVAGAVTAANTYTDGKVTDLNASITTAQNAAETSANTYTDQQVATRETPAGAQAKADAAQTAAQEYADNAVSTRVPQTREINGKPLSADVALSATDVGAVASGTALIALDTDGTPFIGTAQSDLAAAVPVAVDSDGVPYLVIGA